MARVTNRTVVRLSDSADSVERDGGGLVFTMVAPTWLRDPSVSYAAKGFYAHLATYAAINGRGAWPGRKRLAAEGGVAPRTITRLVTDLVAAGWLRVEQRSTDDGGFSTNRYTLLDTDLLARKANMFDDLGAGATEDEKSEYREQNGFAAARHKFGREDMF